MGLWQPNAPDALTLRRNLGRPDLKLLFNINAEFAASLDTRPIELRAKSAVFSSLADAILVSGPLTGQAVDTSDLKRVRDAVPGMPRLRQYRRHIDNVREISRSPTAASSAPISRSTATPGTRSTASASSASWTSVANADGDGADAWRDPIAVLRHRSRHRHDLDDRHSDRPAGRRSLAVASRPSTCPRRIRAGRRRIRRSGGRMPARSSASLMRASRRSPAGSPRLCVTGMVPAVVLLDRDGRPAAAEHPAKRRRAAARRSTRCAPRSTRRRFLASTGNGINQQLVADEAALARAATSRRSSRASQPCSAPTTTSTGGSPAFAPSSRTGRSRPVSSISPTHAIDDDLVALTHASARRASAQARAARGARARVGGGGGGDRADRQACRSSAARPITSPRRSRAG